MANVAYLIKTSEKVSEELFEANNTIPLFWFNLLDLHSITTVEKDLIKSYNNEDDEYITIKLPKKTFIENLYSGKTFIEKNYSDKINLYSDFINYLDKTFNENEILELNILEMANFSSVEELLKDIKKIIGNIHSNIKELFPFDPDKSIFSFVGYDGFFGNEFGNYSKEYFEYCKNETKENKEKIEKENFKKKVYEIKEKITYIILCIGGFAFVGLSIFALIKTGNYKMGILGILFGGVSAFISILKLKNII